MDSSSLATGNSNNSSRVDASEDDASISVTQSLAKEACVLFQLQKYADCLKVLNQLLQKKPDDPKILHNIAIAENFQDGFSNTKRFLEALNNLKQRSETLSRSSGENAEVVNNGSKAAGSDGTNIVLNQVLSNGPQGVSVDDFDVSVIMFNIAVTFYHLHQYEVCFSILERLYQNIEPIDERVARHICLLLLDVALLCQHASRVADVINYLERVGGSSLGGQGDTGSFTQQQQPTNLVTKSTSAPSNVIVSESANPDANVNANGPDSPLSRTLSEETLYESLMSTLDISGAQNITRPSNDLHRTQVDESLIATPDLRLKVHLYKVWVLLLTRNLKAAKREVKMAMNIARGKDYSLALFLKSQLEYARGNHRKAIKLLMASSNQTEMGTSSLYYNNLGCIYYQLGKYQSSAVFFSRAISSSKSLRKERPLKLSSLSQDKSLLFIYNCGLVYLARGKPALAIRCFEKAASVFCKRPLLWLRIAECCIMAGEEKSNIHVKVIGREKWRQLVVESVDSRNPPETNLDLSLPFAKRCLMNALYLLDLSDDQKLELPCHLILDENSTPKGSNQMANPVVDPAIQVNSNGEVKEPKMGNSSVNSSLQSSINDYEGLCRKENQMILQAVVADLAFVHLEMGNADDALAAARCLLRIPDCSRAYVFLGNIYAAEALCLLNQPKQASEHLFSYISGDNTVELPYGQEDCDMWQAKKQMDFEEPNANHTPSVDESSSRSSCFFLKPEEARGTLLANLASIAAAEGDIERAHQFAAQALSVAPNSPEVNLTAIYIDLVRGNTQEAIEKLKRCSCVRFLPGPTAQTQAGSS